MAKRKAESTITTKTASKKGRTKRSEPAPSLGFTDLPPEIRLMIYSYLVDFTGIIIIFAQHEIVREVNRTAISLLHLNKLIRREISTFFYSQQIFQFRSLEAMDNFLQSIGPHFAKCIKNIQIGEHLCRKNGFEEALPTLMKWLPGIERLYILHATRDWVRLEQRLQDSFHTNLSGYMTRDPYSVAFSGHRTRQMLIAEPWLFACKLYYLADERAPELHFLPQDITYENAKQQNKIEWFDKRDAIVEVALPALSLDELLDQDDEQPAT